MTVGRGRRHTVAGSPPTYPDQCRVTAASTWPERIVPPPQVPGRTLRGHRGRRKTTIPRIAWGANPPTVQESTPSTGLSRSTHHRAGSCGSGPVRRLTAIGRGPAGPSGKSTATRRPGLGTPPQRTTTRSPSTRVGSIDFPRTRASPQGSSGRPDGIPAVVCRLRASAGRQARRRSPGASPRCAPAPGWALPCPSRTGSARNQQEGPAPPWGRAG